MHVTQSPVMLVPLIMSLYAWEPLGKLSGVIVMSLDYDAFLPIARQQQQKQAHGVAL